MILELHIIQNFAPSNLNRDDMNAPKDCEFGGYRRARISSQCLKRAVRGEFAKNGLIDAEHRGLRTKRLADALAVRLSDLGSTKDATAVAEVAVQGVGLSFAKAKKEDDEKLTEYLVFLGEREVANLAGVCRANWEALTAVAGGAALPNDVKSALQSSLDGGKAADVALFGRMLADLPLRNVDAASQVAHAISTNKISMEFDFYTAIDDRKPDDTTGAGMMGTIEFNSACFYRYSNVDLGQLLENLGNDEELARATLNAYIRATVAAIPTGKQNSMAAHNPPSFVMAVLRDGGPWSLTNAFLKPVRPKDGTDLAASSITELDGYWGNMKRMYGADDLTDLWWVSLDKIDLTALADHKVDTLRELLDNVAAAASFSPSGARA